jgi:hypothetical protein
MPVKVNLNVTNTRAFTGDIGRAFKLSDTQVQVLLTEFKEIFYPAFTFEYNGKDMLTCSYDKHEVVEINHRITDFTQKVVIAFEKYLKSGAVKPMIILERPQPPRAEQPKEPSDADKLAALALENELLRQRCEMREALDKQPPPAAAMPVALVPEGVTQLLLNEIRSMAQKLQAMELTQQQQGTVINETGERSMQAVNLAYRAVEETKVVRSDVAQQVRSLTTFTRPVLEELDLRVRDREDHPSSPRRRVTNTMRETVREMVQEVYEDASHDKKKRHREPEVPVREDASHDQKKRHREPEVPEKPKIVPSQARLAAHHFAHAVLGALGFDSIKKPKH